MNSLGQMVLQEALDKFREKDPELYELLYGRLSEFSTAGAGRLIVSRLAKELNTTATLVRRRLEILREAIGDAG